MDQTLRLPAVIESLGKFQDFGRKQADLAGLSPQRRAHAELLLEELLVNVIKYAYPDTPGDVELTARADPQTRTLTLTIRDQGPPFDPLAAPPPELTPDVFARQVGGLGLYLVQRLADSVAYRHEHGHNQVEVVIHA